MKESEDRYWQGKSSLEDDLNLKSVENDNYFMGLKEAKKEEMNWSFDDFLCQSAEQSPVEEASKRKVRIKPLWQYVSMVAALVLVGFVFFRNFNTESVLDAEPGYTKQAVEQKNTTQREALPKIKDNQVEKPIVLTKTIPRKKSVEKQKLDMLPKVETQEEEAYVLVNGQRIYDEEAEEVVLASLQLMARNFKEGRGAIEKIKYIKVEL